MKSLTPRGTNGARRLNTFAASALVAAMLASVIPLPLRAQNPPPLNTKSIPAPPVTVSNLSTSALSTSNLAPPTARTNPINAQHSAVAVNSIGNGPAMPTNSIHPPVQNQPQNFSSMGSIPAIHVPAINVNPIQVPTLSIRSGQVTVSQPNVSNSNHNQTTHQNSPTRHGGNPAPQFGNSNNNTSSSPQLTMSLSGKTPQLGDITTMRGGNSGPQFANTNNMSSSPQLISSRTGLSPQLGDIPSRHSPGNEVRVVTTDMHSSPRFVIGPHHEDFHFVRAASARNRIDSRDSLRDMLLRPLANAVAWGVGDIATFELANALGLRVHTTLYGMAPGIQVVSVLPPGYVIAEALPANVALVTYGPAGAMVVNSCVPPGTFVAYQTSTTGVVLDECVVVPSAQPVIVPTFSMITPEAVSPAVSPPAATPATPALISESTSSKIGKIVYDVNQKPTGVLILAADGTQEFVPLITPGSN